MSAHCNDCGADLVYGKGENWQVMTCPVCTLRAALIFWVGRDLVNRDADADFLIRAVNAYQGDDDAK